MGHPPRAARLRALAPAEDDPPEPPDPRTLAMLEQAAAIHRLADAVDALKPAGDTVAGFAGRLDALCKWLKSVKPWVYAVLAFVLIRTLNAAPQDVPKLIGALAEFLRAF